METKLSDKKGKGTSMVAPHPFSGVKKQEGGKKKEKVKPDLQPVAGLANEAGLTGWEMAGLMRAANWAPGKEVTKGEFDSALTKFRNRPQGGGRI